MLPKSRRDIRDFFGWIIREANKYKNSNEDWFLFILCTKSQDLFLILMINYYNDYYYTVCVRQEIAIASKSWRNSVSKNIHKNSKDLLVSVKL
jgi:hypothetical protein